MTKFVKPAIGLITALMLSGPAVTVSANAHEIEIPDCSVNCAAPVIQIALLLDTSNSMDGLIAQTKSQLWMLVNELGETNRHGMTPKIELALYEYGNTNISVSKGYIRQVTSLTTDLDNVSESLFALKTRGGQEYAGQAIATAIDELEWSDDPSAMKLIIIAGNEPFTQGPVHYESACKRAQRKGILIDTIHCGDEKIGIDTNWKSGADCGGGIYMTINQDDVAAFIPSPFDDEILQLNKKLNKTYYGYGAKGGSFMERQLSQDSNAASMGIASEIARAKTKSSKQYDNSTWDLLDAYKKDDKAVIEMEESELPDELKGLSEDERKDFIEAKISERDSISAEIASLEKKRAEFVDQQRQSNAEERTLEQVMIKAVKSQAKAYGLE